MEDLAHALVAPIGRATACSTSAGARLRDCLPAGSTPEEVELSENQPGRSLARIDQLRCVLFSQLSEINLEAAEIKGRLEIGAGGQCLIESGRESDRRCISDRSRHADDAVDAFGNRPCLPLGIAGVQHDTLEMAPE